VNLKLAAPIVAALAVTACSGGSNSMPATTAGQTSALVRSIPQWKAQNLARPACPDLGAGYYHCDALVQTDAIQRGVAGWAPVDFQTRYNLPSSSKGAGQIVAIVDAFDNPNVASDLAAYRSNFGLGTANFTKYNQNGQTSNYPRGDKGWGTEIDLDVEMVSAVCPNCTIYLIEANTNNTTDLETAEKQAVTLGAHVISNSWGGGGGADQSAFNTPGVIYLASAGDGGYGTQAPADLPTVVSVGGTTISKMGSAYNESTWNDTGSGCATGISKPSWQHDSGCTSRTMNDVSAVAFNVAFYDTYGESGWGTVGGTSVSSPLIGGVFGLAGNASKLHDAKKFWAQTKQKYAKDLHDITTGLDGACGGTYLCKAGPGYDGPTGWGTPNGLGAF
jgi:hypothetical protein